MADNCPLDKIVNAINYFTLNLHKKLTETENQNLVCSGYSVHAVLNLLLSGARDLTQREINQTLGYDLFQVTEEDISTTFRQLLSIQEGKNADYDLEVANSVWIQAREYVDANFTSYIKRTFDVEQHEVDFSENPEIATNDINRWVGDKTKGRIPSLFDKPLSSLTLLVLANAVYFKGQWLEQFDKNRSCQEDFFSGEDEKKVLMMKTTEEFQYVESEVLDAQILELPYKGREVSMMILLPKSKNGLETLEKELTIENLKEARQRMSKCEVHVTVPKFSISSTIPLNDVLSKLGIVGAFVPGQADLSGINGCRNLVVSEAIQKADIEVTEEGTVAAAATGMAISFFSAVFPSKEVYFIANHPFLYIIQHAPTGMILFSGRVTHPKF